MANTKDYYDLLGVSREASADEIRKAYLKLAHKYHPDKTGGDKVAEDKLKEINQAYDTLKNTEKRAQYDQFGGDMGDAFSGAGGQGFGGFGGFGGAGGQGQGFEDFFDVLFGRGGGGGGRRSVQPGSDLEVRVVLTLREASKGSKKQVRITRRENCSDCKGTGAAPGSQPETCNDCGGAGQVRRAQGFFHVTQTCPRCRGAGRVVGTPCTSCSGSGKTKGQRELSIDLPAGVDTGSRLRVAGEGEPGDPGAPRGDLYIFVEVEDDAIFERRGNDIICEIPINFPDAALGTTIRVPTLSGEAELKIPPGTQSGTPFRLRNLGMPDLRGLHKGDQIVRIQVETPNKLSREQKDLLQQFKELSAAQSYPLHRRFMDRLKKSMGG
jgi:molecular chaperone DnaJ